MLRIHVLDVRSRPILIQDLQGDQDFWAAAELEKIRYVFSVDWARM